MKGNWRADPTSDGVPVGEIKDSPERRVPGGGAPGGANRGEAASDELD